MKVLHVISSLNPQAGGPTVALVGLAIAQARVGLDVSVLTQHNQDSLPVFTQLEQNGVRILDAQFEFGLMPPPRLIVREIEKFVAEVDIIHLHGLWSELVHQVARTARRLKVPYIIRPCGMLDPWSLAQSRMKKRIYMMWKQRKDLDCAAALHFTSKAECDVTSGLKIKAASFIEPNGIDLTEFQSLPPSGTFRDNHPEIGSKFLIVFLGRIHPGKGLEIVVPALPLVGEDKEAIVVVGGPDSRGYRAVIEEMIEQHNVQDRILFTGMLSRRDCVAALADADLFVLPSQHENFGNAIIEALAAGTPVIVSDQVNIHDQITAAEVGAVVPLDVTAFATTLEQWIDDDILRKAAAQKCRPFVWEQFDWEKIALRWKAHYEESIGKFHA